MLNFRWGGFCFHQIFSQALSDIVTFLLVGLPGEDRFEKEQSQDQEKDYKFEYDYHPQLTPPCHLTEALNIKVCNGCYICLNAHITQVSQVITYLCPEGCAACETSFQRTFPFLRGPIPKSLPPGLLAAKVLWTICLSQATYLRPKGL